MKVSLRGRLRPVFFAQRGQVSEKGSFQPIPNRKFILFNFLGSLEEAALKRHCYADCPIIERIEFIFRRGLLLMDLSQSLVKLPLPLAEII